MDAVDKKILNNYFGLIESLNPEMKLSLIDRLAESIKPHVSSKSKINLAFGAWHSEESAEELIKEIYKSRKTNRQIEEL